MHFRKGKIHPKTIFLCSALLTFPVGPPSLPATINISLYLWP